ncbi:MAG: winged helix-turn-helix domain-containing protein [Caldimonas sp.]
MRVRIGEVVAIGPGKVSLLEAVAEHGSISAAARSLEMSYRRAWMLLDELNRSLKRPAIETAQGGERGGGARLTATGEAVIRHYREAERVALSAGRPQLASLLRLLARP